METFTIWPPCDLFLVSKMVEGRRDTEDGLKVQKADMRSATMEITKAVCYADKGFRIVEEHCACRE